MNIIVFHNSRCSKCRATMDYFDEKDIKPEVVEYLETPPTKEDLKNILKKLDITAHELARKGEDVYKEHNADELSEEELLDLMVQHPILIERPIVVMGDKAIINRPPDRIKEFLK